MSEGREQGPGGLELLHEAHHLIDGVEDGLGVFEFVEQFFKRGYGGVRTRGDADDACQGDVDAVQQVLRG